MGGQITTRPNISTDKAANPPSVLGFSKRITERLTAELNTRQSGHHSVLQNDSRGVRARPAGQRCGPRR
jgi:FlaA1/EpsC-like NDP-sugar epimerase